MYFLNWLELNTALHNYPLHFAPMKPSQSAYFFCRNFVASHDPLGRVVHRLTSISFVCLFVCLFRRQNFDELSQRNLRYDSDQSRPQEEGGRRAHVAHR